MSIERMESILLLVPSSHRDRFVEWLYRERQVHIDEFRETPENWSERFSPIEEDSSHADIQASKLQGVVDFLREIHKTPGDFLESLFPVRMLASSCEIKEAADAVDPDSLASACQKLQSDIESAEEQRIHLAAERDRLGELDVLKVDISRLRAVNHVVFHLVGVTGQAQKSFLNDTRLSEQNIHVEQLSVRGNTTIYIMVAPPALSESLNEIIIDYSLREIVLPPIQGTVTEAIASLEEQIQTARSREKELREQGANLSKEWIHRATLTHIYWESERNRIIDQQHMVTSNNLFAVRGFIRANSIDEFRARLEAEFPSAEFVPVQTYEGEEPPVSVSWNNFLRPAGLLVKMFGLPSYRGIDPTAFLTLSFLTFFGICYGDVLYGVMLILLAWWLRKRFRDQKGLVQFFRLFTYAGVSTVIFGFAVGSWGADLPMYFGEGNVVDKLRLKLCLLDPLTKPVVALGIAVGIGVTNQLYGIFMRFLRDFRRGDIASSIYDGVLWLVYLISLIVLALSLVMKGPRLVTMPALVLFIIAAIGLVLTQGRDQKGLVPRFIAGVVSLYGIMGTYGTTAFVGDVISYSRLMALGMTTSVVGMSFNIIGGMLKEIPYVGWVLFIALIIFGHVFNFVMSILSAFVHSARLILLEWFSRFYEGGGVPFKPFGFSSSRLDLTEN
ncbi:hypothetical protein LLG96_05570 [bacterium]|nr:hypothetical protein [bacterium]